MDGQELSHSLVAAVGITDAEVQQRGCEGSKLLVVEMARSSLKVKRMNWRVDKTLYNRIIVPLVTNGAEY